MGVEEKAKGREGGRQGQREAAHSISVVIHPEAPVLLFVPSSSPWLFK